MQPAKSGTFLRWSRYAFLLAMATVVCETDCALFVIDQRHFLAVLDDVPTLAHKMLASLAGRIRELDRAYFG